MKDEQFIIKALKGEIEATVEEIDKKSKPPSESLSKVIIESILEASRIEERLRNGDV